MSITMQRVRKEKFTLPVLSSSLLLHIYKKLVDCLEKCLIYGHIRRFAN